MCISELFNYKKGGTCVSKKKMFFFFGFTSSDRIKRKAGHQMRPRTCTLYFDHFDVDFGSLHGQYMFAIKAKICGVIYNQSNSIAFDETSIYCSAQNAPNLPAFHWSPHGRLVSINHHFVTTRVVHLPKRTEISLITGSDRSGPNHRIRPGCAGRA